MVKKNYELLAPVGDFAMLSAAVNAGADAVYFGLQEFSMRTGSKNFKLEDLKEIRKVCKKKVKMYLTLNTIIYDNEIVNLEEIIRQIRGKVDAVICWDLSVIQLCRKYKIPFHISTQASVSNSDAARFYKKLGAKRIVVARELNLKQIKEISRIIPVEAFVHGAMCVSVSGRCFTSQFLFCKSANRGECIHPCRRSYTIKDNDEGYELKLENNKVMSAKDLCMLAYVEKMKKAGITGFKIEGRNRDPRYVDVVVRNYRKALDKTLTNQEIKKGMQELENVYNKKFSTGFYLGKVTSKDFSDIENSAAKEKKHFVGKVTHYFDKVEVAAVKLVSNIEIGDKIVIIGNTTGIVNSVIKEIQIQGKKVKEAKKGEEIGIKVPSKVRKNDEMYVLRIKIKKDKK